MSNAKQILKLKIADMIYGLLFATEGSMKFKQIVKSIDVKGITPELVWNILSEDNRFINVQRKWTISLRYDNSKTALLKLISDEIDAYGKELCISDLAKELSYTLSQDAEYFENQLEKLLANKKLFYNINGCYGNVSWLIDTTASNPSDVAFDNYIDEAAAAKLEAAASDFGDGVKATREMVKCEKCLPSRLAAYVLWKNCGKRFDIPSYYDSLASSDKLMLLSDRNIYASLTAAEEKKALAALCDEAKTIVIEDDAIDEPIEITEEDTAAIVDLILKKESITAEEILDEMYDLAPSDSVYEKALQDLAVALDDDERIMLAGIDRWSKKIVIDDDMKEVPVSLKRLPVEVFVDPIEGEYDLLLEVSGLDSKLKSEIYDPLVEDVEDEDEALTNYQPLRDDQICVLTYQHKIEGTFPLCQIHPDFFGTSPDIIPVTFVMDSMQRGVVVNNKTRLIYGLQDFYKDIIDISGAVFTIEKTETAGKYRFVYNGEVNPQFKLEQDWAFKLANLKDEYAAGKISIYDVIIEIMDQHKKGVTFVQLVNEVNVVRRCSRILIASILSSYKMFHRKGKTSLWTYDVKKINEGFDKSKRKYIRN